MPKNVRSSIGLKHYKSTTLYQLIKKVFFELHEKYINSEASLIWTPLIRTPDWEPIKILYRESDSYPDIQLYGPSDWERRCPDK